MIEAKAKLLLTTYGFPDGGWRMFTSHHDNTGDFLVAQHANFAYVATQDDLRRLATYLNPDHLTGFGRGLLLINLNRVAGRNSVEIPAINGLMQNPLLSGGLAEVVINWPATDRQVLINFIQARVRAAPGQLPANIVAQVLPFRNIIGSLRFDILHVLKRVTKAGDRCTLNVRADNIQTLIRVDRDFPQRRFTGFTRWGPGDAVDNDPATNMRNHFKKHVCNSSGLFATDALWWWRALEIKVRVADLENPAASLADQAYFQVDGSLKPARLADFIENVVRARPALIDKLYLHYGAAYCNYAIRLSTQLSGVIVEANAEKVMISGFTGNVTIFGRFDDQGDPASELGISSCYFVEAGQRGAKITVDKPNKIWELR